MDVIKKSLGFQLGRCLQNVPFFQHFEALTFLQNTRFRILSEKTLPSRAISILWQGYNS